jgi:hypothetical protein
MESQSASRASMHPTDRRHDLAGEVVEVWLGGELYRKGLSDAAMPNARDEEAPERSPHNELTALPWLGLHYNYER